VIENNDCEDAGKSASALNGHPFTQLQGMSGQQLEEKSLPWTNAVKNAECVFGWNQHPED